MAVKTTGVKFEFSGDAKKAQAAFRAVAEAAGKTGAEVDKAAKEIERAYRRQEAAAARAEAEANLRAAQAGGGFFGGARAGAASRIENVANAAGLGGALDQFGGAEAALGKLNSKTVVATGAAAGLGAALVKVGIESTQAFIRVTDQVVKVQNSLGGTVEEASQVVGIFRGLGLDVNSTSQELKEFSQNITGNERELRKYGVIVQRTADGNADLFATLLNAASAYQAQTDPAIKARIAAQTFGGEWEKMVKVLETSRPRLKELGALAPKVSEKDIQGVRIFREQWGALKGEAEDTGAKIGGPVLGFITTKLAGVNSGIEAAKDLLGGDFGGAVDEVTGKSTEMSTVFADAADNMLHLALAGGAAAPPIEEVASAADRAAAATERFNALFARQSLAVGAQAKFRQAVAGLAEVHERGAESASRYAAASDAVAKASRDGARAVQDAMEAQQKAATDGAQRIAEAIEAQQKSAIDGGRRIAQAEDRAADQIVDAQERVIEARRQASQAAQDDADRVEDARRALVDAAAAAAGEDNPFEARRQIEDASRDLARAERDATQNAEERARNVAEAEQGLAETQSDAAREVAEARREAAEADAEAIKRVSEARAQAAEQDAEAAQRVADAQQQAAERVQGAQQALTGAIDAGTVAVGNNIGKVDELVQSTFNSAFQLREAGASQQAINARVQEGKDALDRYGASLGLTNQQVAYYKQLLDLIPLTVRTKVEIRFSTIMDNARSFASNAVASAAATAIANQLQIPEFAGGGTFRNSSGAGLAVLHDGEKVIPPGGSAGGGVTINVHGSLVDSPGLLREIERALRRGYR